MSNALSYGSKTHVETTASAIDAAALGDRLWRANRYEDALAQFEEAVRQAPAVAPYRVQLGQCAWMLKQFDVAARELEHALRLSPDNPLVHKVLAEFSFAEGRIERALVHSARAIELSPRDADVIVTRASVLHENSQTAEAWQLIEPLLKAGICSVPLAVLYSRLATQMDRQQAAISCINYLLKVANVSPHGAVRLHFAAAATPGPAKISGTRVERSQSEFLPVIPFSPRCQP